jgi:hypothetical protein
LDLSSPPFTEQLPKAVIDELHSMSLYKDIDSNWRNDHNFLHTAFIDSYLNITTETRANYSLFTEKTAKPLAAGQLFLQVNGPSSIDGLRSIGIETFDLAFDHHQYDQASNFIDRIDHMFALLDNKVVDLEEIYFNNIDKINYNQDYFLSDSFRYQLAKTLRDSDLIL